MKNEGKYIWYAIGGLTVLALITAVVGMKLEIVNWLLTAITVIGLTVLFVRGKKTLTRVEQAALAVFGVALVFANALLSAAFVEANLVVLWSAFGALITGAALSAILVAVLSFVKQGATQK